MDMLRITARWAGFNGAPGYSNFFFAGGGGLIGDQDQVANRVRGAFAMVVGNLPTGVSVSIEQEAAIIDSDTGQVQEYRPVDALQPVTGTGTGGYSAASGGVINWRTSDLRFGRRIRGRTFIVPMSGSSYEQNGTLTTSAIESLRAFGNQLVTWDFDSEFGVWSRPRGGTGGVFATAESFSVPDMAAVLRSRRD